MDSVCEWFISIHISTRKSVHKTRMPRQNAIQKKVTYVVKGR